MNRSLLLLASLITAISCGDLHAAQPPVYPLTQMHKFAQLVYAAERYYCISKITQELGLNSSFESYFELLADAQIRQLLYVLDEYPTYVPTALMICFEPYPSVLATLKNALDESLQSPTPIQTQRVVQSSSSFKFLCCFCKKYRSKSAHALRIHISKSHTHRRVTQEVLINSTLS